MNDLELKNIWKSYDEKLEKTLVFNQQLVEDVAKLKAKSSLRKTKSVKKFALFLGIPWVIFLYTLVVFGYMSGSIFFTISFAAIAIITSIAVWTYIYHLVLINQINNSESVAFVQRKLAKIKLSSVKLTRIVILQIPFWVSFFWSAVLLDAEHFWYWVINLSVFAAFTFLTVWLYRNIKLENMNKKWMKIFFSGLEWEPVIQAIDIMKQLEAD